MITATAQAMQAIAMRYQAQGALFGSDQAMMANAAGVTPDMTSRDTFERQQADVQFGLQAERASIGLQISSLMLASARNLIKQGFALKRRLMELGAILYKQSKPDFFNRRYG